MMRRFLGGRSAPEPNSAKTPQQPLPMLSDDEVADMFEKAVVIGKPRNADGPSPAESIVSTAACSTECSSVGTPVDKTPESSAFMESLRSRIRAPLSQLSKKVRQDGSTAEAGGYNGKQEEETGAGLGFGSASTPSSAACCAAGEDVVVLNIFHSALCSDKGEEQKFKVEVSRESNVAALRKRIAKLYGIPEASQRLQLTPDLGGAPLADSMKAADLVHKPVFLLPAGIEAEEPEAESYSQRRHKKAEREAIMRGMAESLQGVTYNVNVVLPEADGSAPASRTLILNAMALTGDVVTTVKVEMMGGQAQLPMLLIFNGQALPPDVPLHFAGVRDGDTLAAVMFGSAPGMDEEESDDDDEDDPVLGWAYH